MRCCGGRCWQRQGQGREGKVKPSASADLVGVCRLLGFVPMEEPWGDEPSEEQRIGPEISWRVQPSETSRGHKPGDYIDEVWTPVEEWLDVVALSSVCEVVHLFTCRKDYDEADVEVSRHLFEYGTVSIDKRGGVTVQRVKEIKPGRPDNERRGVALPARPVAPAVARLGPLLSKAGVGRVALAMRDGSVLLPASDLGKGDVVCDEAYKTWRVTSDAMRRSWGVPDGMLAWIPVDSVSMG
mmetsp:Transcript_4673/g.15495  ORF Transcript_4673/g.15495 Transcript_4673/m.15495 type:complete len:240 (-) Transcript_4673:358-1077(-)